MEFNKMAEEAARISREHGFWEEWDRAEAAGLGVMSDSTKIALIHSEASEALEELRKNPDATQSYYREDGKPEGVPAELADVVIRVMDFAQYRGIDLQAAIIEKLKFNESRPFKHGKSF